MNPATAIKVREYVRKYGKKWTALQVAEFYVQVARLATSWDAKGTDES